jgi:hypothetical protein
MSEEENGSTAQYLSSSTLSGSAGCDAPGDETLSLTDLIDRLDRASFLASLEHRRGWKAADEPGLPSATYEDH